MSDKHHSDQLSAILVVGPSWVGDMMMAQSLFRLLKQQHPGAAIDVVAPAWSGPLLARMPEVRDVIELPFGHGVFKPMARIRQGQSLKSKQYDWAIVLPYTWKSALLPFGANIPRRTGYIGEVRWGLLNDHRPLDKTRLPMMVQRYVALALDADAPVPTQFPHPKLSSSPDDQQAVMQRLGLEKSKSVMAFCPGAEYGPAKRWPAKYFAEVGMHYKSLGWDVWILGSQKDAPIAAEIQQHMAHAATDLTGKTQLQDVVDVLAIADLALCNDSGLMHIAAALGTPLYALFGSSDPSYTPPLSENAEILSLNLSCSPCFKKECPLGHYQCLQDLTPEKVIGKIHPVS